MPTFGPHPDFESDQIIMWTILEGLEHLTTEEIDTLVSTPVWIAALIGSADGEIDREERAWADRLMHARTYSSPGLLSEYYRVVAQGFLEKVDDLMEIMPKAADARSAELADKIGAVNSVLAKLDPATGASFYKSFITLAQETAKASGGFLRIGAVSATENRWVKLPMITPINFEGKDQKSSWEDEEQEN